MNIADQLKILAKGINPDTGEMLASDSCGNEPEAIRLLFSLADELSIHRYGKVNNEKPKLTREERQAKNLEMGRPKNSHLPWTDEDKKKVIAAFQDNDNLELLAQEFERSVLAMAAQLRDAGFLTDDEFDSYKDEQLAER